MNKLSPYLAGMLLLLVYCSTASADRVFVQLEKTIEEARISVKLNDKDSEDKDGILGTVTTTRLDCTDCQSETFPFTQATRLVNPFGAEKPIKELKNWNGSKALVRYYIESNQIKLIEILP